MVADALSEGFPIAGVLISDGVFPNIKTGNAMIVTLPKEPLPMTLSSLNWKRLTVGKGNVTFWLDVSSSPPLCHPECH